jgi:glycine cleavage system protein P-like pyridoxal-binding family
MNEQEKYYYELSKGMKPIESSNSLHVSNANYLIENKLVKLYWSISSGKEEPDHIEIEDWLKPINERTDVSDLREHVGKRVLIKGWVSQFRELKKGKDRLLPGIYI